MMQAKGLLLLGVITIALYTAVPANASITINTSTATDWKISNGVISLDWNSTTGSVFSVHLVGHSDDLVDTTTKNSNGQPKGLYMDNTGLGSGTTTAGFHQDGNHYVDWWITTASNSSNAFTYSRHFILADNDSGFHTYFVVNHSSSDIAGSIGQIQYVFRISQTLFTNTYSVNSGLNNLGATAITLPSPSVLGNTDPGRQVQNAALDLHGLSLPSGFGREFYTKYDYSSYEYLHRAHGLYGSTYGAWTVIPSTESLVAGPTKQDLIFTDNILMMECQSNHLNNGFTFNVPQGTTLTRMYGPYYFHFNVFGGSNTTPASLYQDALNAGSSANAFYDGDGVLLQNGYVASSGRGIVQPNISGGGSSSSNTAWAILGDNHTNFQYSGVGRQFWVNNNASGNAAIARVTPGAYRLSAYVLGQWGELRQDNVTVTANQTTNLNLAFTPENFGTAPPIWTIGTPDRSAHEFLHGENSSGQDDREYWGNWNYWQDFAANSGAVIYHATAVGSTPATNDLHKWNYVQWHVFNPGLFAGVFNSSDDTTDGYKFICPSYVGNCATAIVPAWQIHFTTTSTQRAQGSLVTLSVGLAAAESDLTVSLNGQALTWHLLKAADAGVRSGFSGTYQWVVFEWSASQLNAAGQDNVITLSTNKTQGVMYDALRMEISNKSANHNTTGWNDYEFIDASTDQPANDSLSNP
jgi:hypothetical protein